MSARSTVPIVVALVGSAAAASNSAARSTDLDRSPASFSAGAAASAAGPFEIVDAEDAAFRLRVGGQVQFRYIANFRDSDDATDDSDFGGGFETRRTKINFSGTTLSKDLSFRIVAAFDRTGDGAFKLEESWLRYKLGDGWSVRAGQFKLPFLREENVSSSAQLAADRSVANEVFNQDFSEAVEFARESEWWRLLAAVSDGFGSRNTAFFSPKEADVALTGRVERRVGEAPWKSYDDLTSFRDSPSGWMVGGVPLAAHGRHGGVLGRRARDRRRVRHDLLHRGPLGRGGGLESLRGVRRAVDRRGGCGGVGRLRRGRAGRVLLHRAHRGVRAVGRGVPRQGSR
ncbi:MAG: OprO/OprP family phosphate-selective porin [Phycisphaerales bacterium]|nr:OprO/OprP family phosphate-selective porin [Phycisphaerales bacterium]